MKAAHLFFRILPLITLLFFAEKSFSTGNRCTGTRSERYQCYKQNIIKARYNIKLKGHWQGRLYSAKEKLEFAKGNVEGKTLDEIKAKCAEVNGGNATTEVRKKRRNFISEFCNRGDIKSHLNTQSLLNRKISKFVRGAERAHAKAKSKFNLHFKHYRAQTLWFTRHFMRELRAETGALKSCLAKTYIREEVGGQSTSGCFYSSLDVAECLSDPNSEIMNSNGYLHPDFLTDEDGILMRMDNREYHLCSEPSADARADGQRRFIEVRSHLSGEAVRTRVQIGGGESH